jgi:hypothetical protein
MNARAVQDVVGRASLPFELTHRQWEGIRRLLANRRVEKVWIRGYSDDAAIDVSYTKVSVFGRMRERTVTL